MRDKLITILDNIDEDIVLFDGDDLFDEGVIDSFTVVEIVSEMEKSFNIVISTDDVIGANFKTVDSMLALVEKIIGKK